MAPSKPFATVVVFLASAAPFRISPGASAQHSSSSHSSHESAAGFGHAALYSMEVGVSNIVAITAGHGEESHVQHEEEYLSFMLVPTTTADEGGLEDAEEAAEAAWESFTSGAEEPTILTTGESVIPSETNVYQVALEDPLVLVPVDLVEAGAFALFLEHDDADEVEVVVTSPSGAVLAAVVEEEGGHDEEEHHDEEEELEEDTSPATGEQWANALVAATVVSACSFVGLLVMMSGRVAHSIDMSHASIFASGALLTASLVHIIPEAMEGLQSKYGDNLHSLGIHAGLSLLIGITFGVVVNALLASSHSHSHSHQYPVHNHEKTAGHVAGDSAATAGSTCTPITCALGTASDGARAAPVGPAGGACGVTRTGFANFSSQALTESASVASATENGGTDNPTNLQALMKQRSGKALLDIGSLQSVCWTVITGDLVHNFADGVTIGAAFLACSSTVGWTVTASAIIHEVPHELADFMALIKGGMSAYQAAVYNFISALSALAGVVLILALRDALTSAQISSILLVGAGSFLFVALSELVPEALEVHPGERARGKRGVLGSQVRKLASFVVGALIIGIPLMFDQHCDAGHDGHDH